VNSRFEPVDGECMWEVKTAQRRAWVIAANEAIAREDFHEHFPGEDVKTVEQFSNSRSISIRMPNKEVIKCKANEWISRGHRGFLCCTNWEGPSE